MRRKFQQVEELIVKLSNREFDNLPDIETNDGVFVALKENLIMLGEELNETTVSKEYFQNIFNSVPEIILITDAKGRIITGNSSLEVLKEKNKHHKEWGFFNDLFSVKGYRDTFASLRNSFRKAGLKNNIRLSFLADQSRIFQCNFGELQSDRRQKKFLALISDITDFAISQKKIAESAIKFKQIYDNTSDGILLLSKEGLLTDCNPAAHKMLFSDTKKKIEQLPLSSFLKASNYPDINTLLGLATEGQPVKNIEVRLFPKKSNKIFDCLFSISAVYEETSMVGYQAIVKDISYYKDYNIRLLGSIGESQENERKRIASDLHDSIGQQLSGIKFMVNSILGIMDKESQQREYLNQINTDIFKVLDELRQICFDLMPRSLEKFGLIKTLEEQFEKLKRINDNLFINFKYTKALPVLEAKTELNLYRIVQEAVNNAIKYAKCTHIHILLQCQLNNKELFLQIRDNGAGFKLKGKGIKGMGLDNIRSRVVALRGNIIVHSSKTTGTIFEILIPLNNDDNHQ
jgi:two-component system, NarL family, sensor histidine kinase NreB